MFTGRSPRTDQDRPMPCGYENNSRSRRNGVDKSEIALTIGSKYLHMGPQLTNKPLSNSTNVVPPSLTDVALIDGQTCAATACMSISWWLAEVAAGRAPAPAIRKPRCTRWRLADVRAWLVQHASQPDDGGAAVIAKATKASRAAKVKRASGSIATATATANGTSGA
jgi:hypothetical protein